MSWDIAQGACNWTPALFGDNPGATWFVRNPGGTIIASNSSPGGWAASVVSFTGGVSVTCCSPSGATIATNYTLQLLPSGNYYAFDVTSAGGGGGGGARRRVSGGWWG